ncbi:hypothetical protein BU24DRAFT_468987 [Aaosphaeria arxii CBS 175.79]|uniref:Uncharacterized protein n=1 Tax=Aaosphaeria arxii CBS 175.79 TaxID=1450172 RepID=A0A6A5X617_9PLEO|nr:uncharacterized protein BU24DRAFT_468987 [Aaosphaeria arxii CBS 175.79]KAF2008389.1 hypothetical protein BU24DRAFT_468987 [Aaosphaeria arxii CBS 175.79]
MHTPSLALTLSILTHTVLAGWDSKLCNGSGGCLGLTWFPGTDYKCPDGVTFTAQQLAGDLLALDNGHYEATTPEQFPTKCVRGTKPGPNDKLVVHTGEYGQLYYAFISEVCREEKPTADCYNQNPNPSSSTLCQITTKDGSGNCEQA